MAHQLARSIIAGLAFLSLSTPAWAQDSTRIAALIPGIPIRYRANNSWVEARLVSVANDTITFTPTADTTRISVMPMAGLDNLQYAKGRNVKLGWGIGIGALVGAGLGVASAVALSEMGGEGGSAGGYAMVVAIPTLGGALLGAGVSALVAGTKWHPVNAPPKVQPLITPTPHGMGMGVSVRF